MSKKSSILVVDDEKNITESLSDILADEGYKVASSESGDEALEMLMKQPYDLVLLDIWLPGRRDGLQTLREIQKRNINTEVIMISGHGSIDTAVRATKLGAFDFIEKPLSLGTVLEAIKSALKNRKSRNSDNSGLGEYSYIAKSPAMKEISRTIIDASKSNRPILLKGEYGTGKEYTAMYIHKKSKRSGNPFIKVDCTTLGLPAFERLFGSIKENPEKSGSNFSKLFGTVYLLNPQLLDKKLQSPLKKFIEASTKRADESLAFIVGLTPGRKDNLESVESLKPISTDYVIDLPALRNRGDDIEKLINHFFENAAEDFDKQDLLLSKKAFGRMLSYPWPGNVRELQTTIENMVMASTSEQIEQKDIPFGGSIAKAVADTGKTGGGKGKSKKTKTSVAQKTIAQSAVITGLGLHSGRKTGLIISPLPPNSGIIFSDIATGKQLLATLENVESTEYATALKFEQVEIKTIEHIMATLHMYGITNALLKVNDEIPIMDGSAVKFCHLIENSGVLEQDDTIEPIIIKEKIVEGEIGDNERYIMIEPSSRLSVEYRMEYPQPIGKLCARYKENGVQSFKNDVAPARTFGFIDDIKQFEDKGLAEGGKLTNVILVDNEKIVNTTLRFEDEFARHKILDILGDFYLLGRPIIGKITANLSGHFTNIAILKKIYAEYVEKN